MTIINYGALNDKTAKWRHYSTNKIKEKTIDCWKKPKSLYPIKLQLKNPACPTVITRAIETYATL